MSENVKMEDGVATQFKGQMQGAFDFLVDCSNSIENCQIVADLGFDNGGIEKFKSSIKTTEDSINGLLESVTSCESEIMQLDSNGTERVSEVFPIDEESHGDVVDNAETYSLEDDATSSTDNSKAPGKSNGKGSSSSGSSHSNGSTSTSSSSSSSGVVTSSTDSSVDTTSSTDSSVDTTSSTDSSVDTTSSTDSSVDTTSSTGSSVDTTSSTDSSVDTTSSTGSWVDTTSSTGSSVDTTSSTDSSVDVTSSTSTTTDTTSQVKNNTSNSYSSYSFTYTLEEALSNGDIFADDKYNLTEFTNYILYRYGIKDKKIAQKIYESVIKYGNNYYNLNGSNPLKVVPQDEILSSIYNDIKNLVPNSNENTFWSVIKNAKL